MCKRQSVTCTTPYPFSLSLSRPPKDGNRVMKSCLAEDKNGWCNHSLSNSDFNFAHFLSNYFFFLVALTFVALSFYELDSQHFKPFRCLQDSIPNAAHSSSSMTMLYVQTL